eukprot:12074763-Karenia_brevis.AAC.1
MKDNAGEHRHEYQGRRVYVQVNKPHVDQARERAVRKVVRVLIEKNGGDGAAVKKRIDALYKSGA